MKRTQSDLDLNKVMGDHQWSYEEEKIERLPAGIYSVGIGRDLIRLSGETSAQKILDGLSMVLDQLIDGGANVGRFRGHKCYFRKRGKAIDIGTRADFEEIGWGAICKELDRLGQ